MPEIDVLQILLTVFGGLGVGTFVATYLQLREQRKQYGKEYFRQLVLTTEFLEALGTLGRMLAPLMQVQNRGSGYVVSELRSLIEVSKKQLDEFRNSGRMLLLPNKLARLITDLSNAIDTSVDDLAQSRGKGGEEFAALFGAATAIQLAHVIRELSQELKRITGIDELE